MTRPTPYFRLAATVVVLAVTAALAACTAQPATTSTAGSTAQPAAVPAFSCPTEGEVAALTAVPLTVRSADSGDCTYVTAPEVEPAVRVTLRHPAAVAGRTLAALRYAATGEGTTTADLRRLAFDAFTSATERDCTAWFPAADGAVTSVTAVRSGVAGRRSCDLATAVAALADTGSARAAGPTVAVVAASRLLDESTADARWPWRIGRTSAVRVDRLTGTGYLRPSRAASFATAAGAVPKDSDAVVFVSGTAEAGADRLDVLSGATAALSAAATRAPNAQLVVVGPVADGAISFADLAALRSDLQSAATIAGARYVDPTPAGAPAAGAAGTSAALDLLADAVSSALRASDIQGP